jgi:hypothetical protein
VPGVVGGNVHAPAISPKTSTTRTIRRMMSPLPPRRPVTSRSPALYP